MNRFLSTVGFVLLLTSLCKSQDRTTRPEGTRQVHLDFHNSELLRDVGSMFNREQFKKALQDASVNSINIFAKGHHGWSYYPTQFGKMHPSLKIDLFGEQLKACHEIGVRAQAYFTVGWSVKDAREHPEWKIIDQQGSTSVDQAVKKLKKGDPFPTFTWELLSPEGGYLELILKQTEELCTNYELDGFWYDIIPYNNLNYNAASLREMKMLGIDPLDTEKVNSYHVKKMEHFMESCNNIIKKHRPDASIFYNWSTHMGMENTFRHDLHRFNTKHDLEDLPTTWAGYDVFPLRAKYFSNTGKSITGMSGKFHTAWGEFGGFKYPDALRFEAASMVAMGANVNFGDQLHPSGVMDADTYKNIGYAFDYVKKIENYGIGGKQLSDLGLWMTFDGAHDEGVTRMLLEKQMNFVVANNLQDWKNLKVLIIPGKATLDSKNVKRIETFINNGGKVLVFGEGGLDKDRKRFLLDVGAQYTGPAEFDIDYTMAGEELAENFIKSPFLNYIPGIKVKPAAGTLILAHIREPFFSRTPEHYSSHQNTPYQLKNASHPAIIQKGNVIWMAHALDKSYFLKGARIHRELFINTLKRVYTDPMLEAVMPSAGRVNLLHFPDQKRYVVHLLYGPPLQRGAAQVIEDMVPLFDVPVSLKTTEKIKKVYEVPGLNSLDFETNGNRIEVKVSKLQGHTAIVFEYQ